MDLVANHAANVVFTRACVAGSAVAGGWLGYAGAIAAFLGFGNMDGMAWAPVLVLAPVAGAIVGTVVGYEVFVS